MGPQIQAILGVIVFDIFYRYPNNNFLEGLGGSYLGVVTITGNF